MTRKIVWIAGLLAAVTTAAASAEELNLSGLVTYGKQTQDARLEAKLQAVEKAHAVKQRRSEPERLPKADTSVVPVAASYATASSSAINSTHDNAVHGGMLNDSTVVYDGMMHDSNMVYGGMDSYAGAVGYPGNCQSCNTYGGGYDCQSCQPCYPPCNSCQPACQPKCQPSCCCTGLYMLGEATYFRYHRADGVRVGTAADDPLEFDLELAPRVTVGFIEDNGYGVRLRWWDYDHRANGVNGNYLDVDTYTFDLEAFRAVTIAEDFILEFSAGARYNDFLETMVDNDDGGLRTNAFRGFGGIVGLQLNHVLMCCDSSALSIFGRARGAIMMDDKHVTNTEVNGAMQDVRLLDVTQGMMELAVGFEVTYRYGGLLFFGQGAAEYQNWFNYSSAFDQLTAMGELFDGSSDVGFGGVVASIGVSR